MHLNSLNEIIKYFFYMTAAIPVLIFLRVYILRHYYKMRNLPPSLENFMPFVGDINSLGEEGPRFLTLNSKKYPKGFTFNMGERSGYWFSDKKWSKEFCTSPSLSLLPMMELFFGDVLGKNFLPPNFKAKIIPKFSGNAANYNRLHIYSIEECKKMLDQWGDEGEANLSGYIQSDRNSNFLGYLFLTLSCRYSVASELNESSNSVFKSFINFVNGIDEASKNPFFKYFILGKAHKAFQHFQQLLQTIQEKREADISTPNSSYQDMLSLLYEDSSIKDKPIYEVAKVIMPMLYASVETSKRTTVHLLDLLMRNPDSMLRVRKEIDHVLSENGGKYTVEANKSQVMLENCIMEALRLRTGLFSIRITTEPYEWNGYSIPANSPVVLSPYSLHHNVAYWEQPTLFIPDRFFDVDEQNKNFVIQSFSMGRHACPGKFMAISAIKTCVTYILTNYDINLVNDDEPVFDWLSIGELCHKDVDKLNFKYKKRKNSI